MVKLSHLFESSNQSIEGYWGDTKNNINDSIDTVMSKGTVDPETLSIMKELLELAYPSTMTDYVED